MHMFFHGDYESIQDPKLPPAKITKRVWGANGKEWLELLSLTRALSRMDGRKRKLLLELARRVAQAKRERVNSGS